VDKCRTIKKVALLGAESTGKTTLAATLATHYGTVWVPEYAREFLGTTKGVRLPEFMVPIALGHVCLESSVRENADRILFSDSCLLATSVWSMHYFGSCDQIILEMVDREVYDLYILLDTDVPWVSDGLRDSESSRDEIHQLLQYELIKRKLPYVLISGTFEERIEKSREIIDVLLNGKVGAAFQV
jgi:NadR type nicotinamide-nucleotide adenylyltransferase